MTTRSIAIAAAIAFAIGCTTQFEEADTGADTGIDTSVDTTDDTQPPDGTDPAPDTGLDPPPDTGTDTSPDVIPDGPTLRVVCEADDSIFQVWGSEILYQISCETGDRCTDTGLWASHVDGELWVVHGNEDGLSSTGSSTFALDVLDPGGTAMLTSLNIFDPDPSEGMHPDVTGASILSHTPGELNLLHGAHSWSGGEWPDLQTVRSLRLSLDGTGSIVPEFLDLIQPYLEMYEGRLVRPVGTRTLDGDTYLFVGMEETGPMFDLASISGMTYSWEEFVSPAMGVDYEDWRPLHDDMDKMYVTSRPAFVSSTEAVVLPYMFLDFTTTPPGQYHTGTFSVMGPLWGDAAVVRNEIVTTHAHSGNSSVAWLEDDTVAFAAYSSDSYFSMSGIAPPYELNVALMDDPWQDSYEALPGGSVPENFFRNMEYVDFGDWTIVPDRERGFFYVVGLFYPDDNPALIRIQPYNLDGTQAGSLMTINTNEWQMQGFDVAWNPDDGSMVLVYMGSPIESGWVGTMDVEGFHTQRVHCRIVDG